MTINMLKESRVRIIKLLLALLLFGGCVQMRDYTGVRDGAFGLDIKKGFGEGEEKKDYCLMEDGEAIVVGDTKNEIIAKIGLPKNIDMTLDGFERWAYENKKIDLFFEGNRLNGWSQSRYKQTPTEEKE